MIKYLIMLVFVLSVAITAGSILISSKLRSTYKPEFLSTLLYFQAFYFTFGFYTIWGRIILVSFLAELMTGEVMNKTTTLLTLLGAPFLILTWLMLLKFARELSGRNAHTAFIPWFLFSITCMMAGIGYLFSKVLAVDSFTVIRYGFIFINLAYTLTGVMWLLVRGGRRAILKKHNMNEIAAGLLLVMAIQNITLAFYNENIFIILVFILVFFISGAFIPLYLRYRSDSILLRPVGANKMSFEEFCSTFDISTREKDVIREICNGLSNQQIADKLFISLQTVKDHTSRIYYKSNCNSRAQLITMLKDST